MVYKVTNFLSVWVVFQTSDWWNIKGYVQMFRRWEAMMSTMEIGIVIILNCKMLYDAQVNLKCQ